MRALRPLAFRKSSYSQDGDCVQWAHNRDSVHISDSKDPEGIILSTTHGDWAQFTISVLTGRASQGSLTYSIQLLAVSVFLAATPELSLSFDQAEWTAFRLGIAAGEVHERLVS